MNKIFYFLKTVSLFFATLNASSISSLNRRRLYSIFNCQNRHWSVRKDDNEYSMKQMQNWISFRQNSCDKVSGFATGVVAYAGIGSAYVQYMQEFIKQIELNNIFLPMENTFNFVYEDPSLCTRRIDSLDCFSQPLSYCNPYDRYNMSNIPTTIDFEAGKALLNGPSDICGIAEKLKKPMMWVVGQIYIYMLRLRADLEVKNKARTSRLLSEMRAVKPPAHQSHLSCVTAGIHIRMGNLDSDGRKVTSGLENLEYLKKYSKDLESEGKRICAVYVASDHPSSTIFAEAKPDKPWTNADYFTFFVLEHFITADEKLPEVSDHVNELRKNNITEMVYLDYVLEFDILTEVEVFIGVASNLFNIVAPLRIALHPEVRNNHTCFLDTFKKSTPLVCIGNDENIWLWSRMIKLLDNWVSGGEVYFPDSS